jgi:uncharacterized SAM-binding protein YcdF (DUF218 family)
VPAPSVAASRRRKFIRFAGGFSTAAVALPLAQMLFFGTTDYRRQADAIVVFGAAVDAEGRPSLALADRVETACRLYHEGRAPVLIFSGGRGPGQIDEADAMRNLALRRGVPADAIVLDHDGVTTDATVRNTAALLDARNVHRVLAVSHAYHLPRVKLAYQSTGREVFTVPAQESRTLTRMPYYVLRETAAMWLYYARGVLRG